MPAPNLTFDFLTLQGLIADRLIADPWFNDIPVITQAVDNVQKEIDEAISRTLTFVIVDVVGFREMSANQPFRIVGEVDIDVTAWECVVLNDGASAPQKRALHTAQVILYLLKLVTWPGRNPMRPREGRNNIERVTDPDCDGYLLPFTMKVDYAYTPSAETVSGHGGAGILGAGGQIIQTP
jgi:hypothetical protein